MTLALAHDRCVRTRAVGASCQVCVDVCPHAAVRLGGPRNSVQVEVDACTGCGLCQGECPTEAFSGTLDVPAWMASLPPGDVALGCGRGVDCLGAVSSEDLVSLALHHGAVRVDTAGCARCQKPGRSPSGVYGARVAGAQAFLSGIGSTASVRTVVRAPTPPEPLPQARRGFLSRLVPGLARAASGQRLVLDPQALDPQRVRIQAPPARRARLRTALQGMVPARAPGPVDAVDVPFTSSKALNTDTCTVCHLCVTTCPTGALSASRLRDELRLDTSACVKCGTCHDVCAPHALTLAPRVDTRAFLAGAHVPLGRLPVKNCGECGRLFPHRGGDVVCPSCADLDSEARELAGVTRRES